jgi:hypothetical protein
VNTTALAVVLQLVTAAAQVTVSEGEEVTVAVAPGGVTVQLPDVVRVVTPAGDYAVRPLGAARAAAAAAKGAAGASPQPAPEKAPAENTDVRVFLVRPAKPAAGEQPVTFLLADRRSVTVRFIPGTVRDDTFVDIRWSKKAAASGARGRAGEQFLGSERALLLAMLRNEPSYGRKVVEETVELPGYPDLEVKLLRTYASGDGLVGGVYSFTNRSRKTVVVNPTVLAVGTPNRAVLTQMDHEELKSCGEDNRPDPRGTGCMSVVRIVSRAAGREPVTPGTMAADRPGAAMPFVLVPKPGEKR